MIAHLRGTLIHCIPGVWVLECGGVGYQVSVPDTDSYTVLPDSEQSLHIHHYVSRDDGRSVLYGFMQRIERDLFARLQRLRGLGPAVALQLLSQLGASGLLQALNDRDAAALVRVKGVGAKTAERLLLEIGDAASEFAEAEGLVPDAAGSARAAGIAALRALGIKSGQALEAVDAVLTENPRLDEGEIIRAALLRLRTG